MKLDHLPEEFNHAVPVIEALEKGGFEAYFVGGCVRDVLLDAKIHDVDIATSAYPEEIKKIFKRTIDIGIQHGTVLVLHQDLQYEITTFRTESTYQDFRRPDKVTFVRSLKEDLKRRDFTINAMAMDRSGEIYDLFYGLKDLKQRSIRAVGDPSERFHEDALRMMRGLRFASQLDFSIEKNTLEAIKMNHSLLKKISVERIQIEFLKLLRGKNRVNALNEFIETDCFGDCPGLSNKKNQLLLLTTYPNSCLLTSDIAAWTLLCYTLGFNEIEVSSFLRLWKCSNATVRVVAKTTVALHHRLRHFWKRQELYSLGIESAMITEELLSFFKETPQPEKVKQMYKELPIHALKDLSINGSDVLAVLKKKGGSWVGVILAEIEKEVLYGQLPNEKKVLLDHIIKQKTVGTDPE